MAFDLDRWWSALGVDEQWLCMQYRGTPLSPEVAEQIRQTGLPLEDAGVPAGGVALVMSAEAVAFLDRVARYRG